MTTASVPLRIALLGLFHEANSFSREPADEAFMRRSGIHTGSDLLAEYRGSAATMGGFIRALETVPDVEIVPLVMTTLVPRGPITADALHNRLSEFEQSLVTAGALDGVLVALHGAAVATDVDDVDGLILTMIRGLVGSEVVIGASLDLHANLSPRMCEAADVLNTYRTNPHVDAAVVAEEIAEIVVAAARGDARPQMVLVQIPAAINILKQNTDDAPMRDILAESARIRERPGVLSTTVAQGYPYADVAEMGMAVVVVTDGDPVLAADLARDLAESVWDRRDGFIGDAPDSGDALREALAESRRPVLVLDTGDNIGGGSRGDSIALLVAARELDIRSFITIVVSPESAAIAHTAGVGARVELPLGGGWQPSIRVTGTVLAVGDGVFDSAGEILHAGFRHFDAGPSAAVRLEEGQTVVVTSETVLPLSPEQITMLGLDLTDFDVVVAKGVHSPLAGYGPRVGAVIRAATPGVTSADLGGFDYRRRRKGLFPWEPDATFHQR